MGKFSAACPPVEKNPGYATGSAVKRFEQNVKRAMDPYLLFRALVWAWTCLFVGNCNLGNVSSDSYLHSGWGWDSDLQWRLFIKDSRCPCWQDWSSFLHIRTKSICFWYLEHSPYPWHWSKQCQDRSFWSWICWRKCRLIRLFFNHVMKIFLIKRCFIIKDRFYWFCI